MRLPVAQVIGGLQVGGAERNLVNTFNAMDCSRKLPRQGDLSRASFHDQLDPAIE